MAPFGCRKTAIYILSSSSKMHQGLVPVWICQTLGEQSPSTFPKCPARFFAPKMSAGWPWFPPSSHRGDRYFTLKDLLPDISVSKRTFHLNIHLKTEKLSFMGCGVLDLCHLDNHLEEVLGSLFAKTLRASKIRFRGWYHPYCRPF